MGTMPEVTRGKGGGGLKKYLWVQLLNWGITSLPAYKKFPDSKNILKRHNQKCNNKKNVNNKVTFRWYRNQTAEIVWRSPENGRGNIAKTWFPFRKRREKTDVKLFGFNRIHGVIGRIKSIITKWNLTLWFKFNL